VRMLHSAFPDFYILPQDMVVQGDTVVARWRGGGTHIGGPLRTTQGDIPASGKKFEIDGMTWLRIVDGKIVEAIGHEDTVGLLVQLGVIPREQGEPELSPEENRAVVARYFNEVMNQGKMEVIEEICDRNFAFIIPTQPEPIRGFAGFAGFVTYLRNAFPDIRFTVEREIAAGNKVASRWRINGTHQGEFLGAPATGRTIQDYGIDIFTLARGKIVTLHVNENDMGLFQQLGLA
jgi:steroid delta-isomerase-like uncharacterized protein